MCGSSPSSEFANFYKLIELRLAKGGLMAIVFIAAKMVLLQCHARSYKLNNFPGKLATPEPIKAFPLAAN
jgi:hypothetical protein